MEKRMSMWMTTALLLGCAGQSSADQSTQPPEPMTEESSAPAMAEEPAPSDESQGMAQADAAAPGDVLVDDNNVAAMGYDVVAYHSENAAQKGDPGITAEHDGVTYLFASEEHKQEFEANPDKYLPAYGGYCAFAVAAQGRRVPPNPESYKVQDGRLFLFTKGVFDGKEIDALAGWEQNPDAMAQQADANWTKPPTN